MPIHSKTNLYPGINAHLNSFLQQEGGGWESFHAEHIIDLRRVLAQTLPRGYYAVAEKSLQGETCTGITVYQGETYPGKIVCHLELRLLLHDQLKKKYIERRHEVIEKGTPFIEIDYLHQASPSFHVLPDYTQNNRDAFPYWTVVCTPQNAPNSENTICYVVGAIKRLPVVAVPISPDTSTTFDLQEAYNRTFESSRFYTTIVDYAAEPVNFDRYREDDQAKIRALLETIRRERGGQSA
jgi:hypothetical protein